MKKITCVCELLLVWFVYVSAALKLPDNFQVCKVGDDNCLNEAIQKALQHLCDKGLPGLKIPKLEPIEIPEINIGTKGNAVDIVQKYMDVKVTGFRNAKVSKAHLDWDKKFLTFTTTAPKFEQISNYNISGRILIFPLYGKGKAVLTQENTAVTHNVQFEPDNDHLKIKSYAVNMEPERITFDFENLFNGNKMLSDRVLKVVNENWQVLWTDSKKDFEYTYAQIYRGIAQRFFGKIPAADIFASAP